MKFFSYLFFIISATLIAQNPGLHTEEIRITPLIDGTLLVPDTEFPPPLAIFIAGSGPTDRNGNQPMMQNNSLRFLAEELTERDIATFRYDKRIVKLIQNRNVDERKLRFDDFIDDAIAVLNHFKGDERFSKIYIIGHSQGSLIGMVAAQHGADGFISIAGAGQEIDDVIVDQLAKQAPGLTDSARLAFDDLRANGIALNYDSGLGSIFRAELQPFILSWMQFDPQEEIAKLNMPVLIINGDKDIQVLTDEAEILHQAKPDATLLIIENMNHVLKEVHDMGLENQKSYNIHHLPVVPELVEAIGDFILN